jgi:hypothetical protein
MHKSSGLNLAPRWAAAVDGVIGTSWLQPWPGSFSRFDMGQPLGSWQGSCGNWIVAISTGSALAVASFKTGIGFS